MNDEMIDVLGLGPCCACDGRVNVWHVIALTRRLGEDMLGASLGWGCFVCGLPSDGAVAVLCDGCMLSGAKIVYARLGGRMEGRRVRLDSFPEVRFDHNLLLHPDLFPANSPEMPAFCFEDSPDVGPDCLCSWCGRPIEGEMAVRVFREDGWELRFHESCHTECLNRGW